MASATPRTWRYIVFTNFHGPDVGKALFTQLRKQFSYNGVSLLIDDQRIERGQTIIKPEISRATSRISIVVLSKNYASSSLTLDELVEIFICKKDMGHIVMTIFYGVDPRDVREQTGEFGKVFKKTCAGKTEELRRTWSHALNDVGNIPGEHFFHWDNEMIEKIARDVSNTLNATVSLDLEDMVGIEAHLQRMQSLLEFKNESEAMIVGIYGPAGIGKTTIARALHGRFSSSFPLSYFMDNLSGRYSSDLDDYGVKLRLQEKLLSNVLNEDGIRIDDLGAIHRGLYDKKVLIILDDVDDLQQLEALAKEAKWFGPGSRIIVTTEDQDLLEKHGINNTYQVEFPNDEEARQIFCRYAFNQSSALEGFDKLVERVREFCSDLPMSLRVMGASLRRKKEEDWEHILHRLETSLDPNMKGVLSVGYDSLHKDDQFLFLLIAFFFNYQDEKHVINMLSESHVDVGFGLKALADKSLIQITKGKIVMHKLLQQVGREAVQRQDHEKRQVLIHGNEIRDVLLTDSGSTSVRDIYFDTSTISKDVYVSAGAFRKMCNLQSLSIYNTRRGTHANDDRVHVPGDMDLPPRLRLLRWEAYPGNCLPHTFMPEHLIRLVLRNSKLKKLWEGTQPLRNLKKMDLSWSMSLKELPDLSKATSLERLKLSGCKSLIELPSSIGNLPKLEELKTDLCDDLQLVPTLFNMTSLAKVDMLGCRKLRKIPDFPRNIQELVIPDTMLEESPESVSHWSRLWSLTIHGSVNPYPILTIPWLKGSGADIEKLPDWIKDLPGLTWLYVGGCPKLASSPKLPPSLQTLKMENCESLETLKSFPPDSEIEDLHFPNCFRLGPKAREVITHKSLEALLPGRTMPPEFDHRAIGNSLTIRSRFSIFRICLVLSPKPEEKVGSFSLFIQITINGSPAGDVTTTQPLPHIRKENKFLELEEEADITFDFITSSQYIKVTECGVQLFYYFPFFSFSSLEF
ncbi:unnamed protein product [Microthlaspi erraticum]|uniref:TIR domain-containing protein n=1 Tax=Microthlaspi erraticum TaxID=1685480 RepID=A0A6D2KXP9_9BRAS|nr:unnamed protein product [Microthlaspi erraticum]